MWSNIKVSNTHPVRNWDMRRDTEANGLFEKDRNPLLYLTKKKKSNKQSFMDSKQGKYQGRTLKIKHKK